MVNFSANGWVTSVQTGKISESTMMGRGMSYESAHAAAIEKYGVSPFSLYHPEVIQQFPGEFNNAWRAYWGIQ